MKFTKVLIILGVLFFSYALWFFFRETIIVGVHKEGDAAYILVKNPPLLDSTKLKWWKEKSKYINENYHIPVNSRYGFILIMDYGKGYQLLPSDKRLSSVYPSDYICFDDMKTRINCLYKNWIMSISNKANGELNIKIKKNSYTLKKDGSVVED